MPRVSVRLPGLLAPIVKQARSIEVEGATLKGVLDELVRLHPALGVHLFDETGNFRRHVLCFHNGTNTRWLEGLALPVAEGDEITLMQAVSGG